MGVRKGVRILTRDKQDITTTIRGCYLVISEGRVIHTCPYATSPSQGPWSLSFSNSAKIYIMHACIKKEGRLENEKNSLN